MHIIIGLITAIAGLIWALNSLQRAGVDLNSFNPFTWARRRQWEKLYGTKPLHNIEKPIEAASVILVGLLAESGPITTEQKDTVLQIFVNDFKLSDEQARDNFSASYFLVKDEINLHQSISKILAPSIDLFNFEQKQSLLRLAQKVSDLNGEPNEAQTAILVQLNKELAKVA